MLAHRLAPELEQEWNVRLSRRAKGECVDRVCHDYCIANDAGSARIFATLSALRFSSML
jgi:hypothetical protein